MRTGVRGGCRAALAALALACAEDAPVHVAWPAGDFAAAFLLELREGQIGEITGPFELLDGALTSGVPQLGRPLPEDGTLVFLGLEGETMAANSPLWPGATSAAVSLERTPETCEGGRRDLSAVDTPRHFELRALSPKLFELDASNEFAPIGDDDFNLSQLSLRVPENPELCLPGRSQLQAFGAVPRLFEGVSSILGRPLPELEGERNGWTSLIAVQVVSETHALAAAHASLYSFVAGAPFLDDERHVWRAENIQMPERPGEIFYFSRVFVDPRSPIEGRTHILVIAFNNRLPGSDHTSVLFELWLDETGFSGPTFRYAGARPLRNGAFEADGRFIGVGGDGLVIFVDPNSGEVTETTLETFDPNLQELELTTDPARPHLVVSKNTAFFLGDLETPTTGLRVDADGRARETIEAAYLMGRDGAAMVFVSSYDSGYAAYDESSGWRPFLFDFPKEATGCVATSDACGRQSHQDRFVAVASNGQRMVGISQACTSAFELNLQKRCVLPVPVSPSGLTERASVERNFRAIHASGGRTLVAGHEGTLLTVEPTVE